MMQPRNVQPRRTSLRKTLLLAVLSVLLAILAYDHWPPPAPPVDPATLTIAQLLAGESWEYTLELRKRAWLLGPGAFEEVWSHEDQQVRTSFAQALSGFDRNDADAAMASKWRDRVLRAMVEDPDKLVRTAATFALTSMLRHQLDAPAPPALLTAMRTMLASDLGHERFTACMQIRSLGERAAGLHADLLSMEVNGDGRLDDLRKFVCMALGSIGVVDDQSIRYLCDALRDRDAATRSIAANSLGELSLATPDIIRDLGRCTTDHDGDVRASALMALADLALESSVARRYLPVAMRSREDFADLPEWLRCVGQLASLVKDHSVHEKTVAALRDLAHEEDTFLRMATIGAIAQIAIAGGDEELLDEVLPELLAELEPDWESGEIDWLSEFAGPRLLYEALVGVCIWRKDARVCEAVTAALTRCAASDPIWIRSWSLEQLARLRR